MRYIQARTFSETHTQGVTSVLFAPDGALLATSDLSGKMCIWDSSSGKLLHVYTAGTSILALCWFGLDEIMCGMADGAVMRVTFGSEEVSVTGKWCHAYPVEHLAICNTFLASGAREELFIWSLRGSDLPILKKELTSPVASDGEEVVITGLHWDTTTGGDVKYLIATYMDQGIFPTAKYLRRTNLDSSAEARSSLSPDGSRIVVSNLLTGFDVYDVESGSLVLTLFHKVSKQYTVPVVYGHGGHAIISGSTVGVIDIWYIQGTLSRKMTSLRVPGGRRVQSLSAHYDAATDQFMIAAGVMDGDPYSVVTLWKAGDGRAKGLVYTTNPNACVDKAGAETVQGKSRPQCDMESSSVIYVGLAPRRCRCRDRYRHASLPSQHARNGLAIYITRYDWILEYESRDSLGVVHARAGASGLGVHKCTGVTPDVIRREPLLPHGENFAHLSLPPLSFFGAARPEDKGHSSNLATFVKPSSKFSFRVSVPVQTNVTTHIDIRVPSAPWRKKSIQPTITRRFKIHGSDSSRRAAGRSRRNHPEDGATESEMSSDDNESVSSRSVTPTVLEGEGKGQGAGSSASASRLRTQSPRPEPFIDLKAHGSRKGKGRAFRSSSVLSEDVPYDPPLPSGSASTSRARGGSVPPPADGPAIWTRFGVQNGEPVFVKEHRHSSTTDKDCITYWWDCNSREPLREPPDIKDKSELACGDLFCNHIAGVDMPQVWLCSAIENGRPVWKPIAEGEDRPDGRKLSITPKTKKPSWVKAQWCVKQMVHRASQGESHFASRTYQDADYIR
ncbi:hypothetical protein NUW54_g9347 [Trametes sanguinea]|uniref:Uncharacterized protein n=1 Tax=Trametes sanguinea TaxID=158606 RepID=A0ACC1P6V2_9APHY|nr:hypothetical protein NUW54_g9347 [Trametes sanguinea]